jgi:hypothetical protein
VVDRSKLVDYHLPRECAHVRATQLDRLRHEDNLSITFDGNTTGGQDSIYTIHIITSDRRVYLFEGNSQSDKSHGAEHLFSIINGVSALLQTAKSPLKVPQQVMVEVGPERFNSICSDDTGSTHNTRGLTQTKYCWILNTPDPCHCLSNLIKDITAISHFKPVSIDFVEV